MSKVTTYLKEVYVELLEKTTWPTFKVLQRESLIVLIASIIFAVIIVIMDAFFSKVMDIIYNL